MGIEPQLQRQPKFPQWATELLSNPTRMELLRLYRHVVDGDDVEDEDSGEVKLERRFPAEVIFNDHLVHRRVEIPTADTARRIGLGLAKAIGDGNDEYALCFDGEWGVRVEGDSDWLQLAICFGCGNFLMTSSRGDSVMYSIARRMSRPIGRVYRWYRLRESIRNLIGMGRSK